MADFERVVSEVLSMDVLTDTEVMTDTSSVTEENLYSKRILHGTDGVIEL